MLDGIARNGISLSRGHELGAQWGALLGAGPQSPLCRADLAVDPDMGLPVFGTCVRSLHSRLSEFLHGVVACRRDESVRGQRSWILEDPLVHPYRWLQPDLVPPSPFLSCDPDIAHGGSGVLAAPVMSSSGRPGFLSSGGQTEVSLTPLFSMQKLGVGCKLFLRWISLLWLGKTFFDAVQKKKPTAGSLDGWGWRELKGLPLAWFDCLAVILSRIELEGIWPEEPLDAYIAMIPKVDGDSSPLGQRPLCVLPVVYRLWASVRLGHLTSWFQPWMPDSVFSAGGGRCSWYFGPCSG